MARRDAKRVPLPGMTQMLIDLKPNRFQNECYINEELDVTELLSWLEARKAAGTHYTFFHAIAFAFGKVIYNRPKINYFIANRHMWQHNDVMLAFVAKMEFTDRSEEIMVCLPVAPEDTLADFSANTYAKVGNARGEDVEKHGANTAIDVLGGLPNPIRIPILGAMKALDKRGHLPASLQTDLVYYSSMMISNLGSIKCGAAYHNVTDFGTCSTIATIGEIRPKELIRTDGTREIRKVCEVGVTIDERVADGYYYAKSLKLLQHILSNPDMLMEGAGTPVEMPELR